MMLHVGCLWGSRSHTDGVAALSLFNRFAPPGTSYREPRTQQQDLLQQIQGIAATATVGVSQTDTHTTHTHTHPAGLRWVAVACTHMSVSQSAFGQNNCQRGTLGSPAAQNTTAARRRFLRSRMASSKAGKGGLSRTSGWGCAKCKPKAVTGVACSFSRNPRILTSKR